MESLLISRNELCNNFLKNIVFRLDFQGVLESELFTILESVKVLIKNQGFTKYNERISNQIGINLENPAESIQNSKLIKSIKVYSFANEPTVVVLDLSTKFICININSTKYIHFENYRSLLYSIYKIYNEKVSFFTLQRIGLRKINNCWLKNKEDINLLFNSSLITHIEILSGIKNLSSRFSSSFTVDDTKINLTYILQEGLIADNQKVYQITIDSDAYIDDKEKIIILMQNETKLNNLNDILFNIYINSISEKFIKLLKEKDFNYTDVLGVEAND